MYALHPAWSFLWGMVKPSLTVYVLSSVDGGLVGLCLLKLISQSLCDVVGKTLGPPLSEIAIDYYNSLHSEQLKTHLSAMVIRSS